MSWILEELAQAIDERREHFRKLLLEKRALRVYDEVNALAASIGRNYGVNLALHFPLPGQIYRDLDEMGRRDISILMDKGRKKFAGIAAAQVHEQLLRIFPEADISSEVGYGYEGFDVRFKHGRIVVLPGGIYLWCEITPRVTRLLDWLFPNAYGLKGPVRRSEGSSPT